MRRVVIFIALTLALVASGGCSNAGTRLRQNPAAAAALPPGIRHKIERGIIEPGFTPEMVYLALGKPMAPATADVALTGDATWIYRDFNRNDRDFIRAGFRRRVVFDPVRRGDVIVTEPVDPRLFPHLLEHSLHVTFREGRVVDIQRTTL